MFSAVDERFPRDHPEGTPAGPSTAEGRTTWVASLNHVYLLGTGSWISEFSGPVRVLMPG